MKNITLMFMSSLLTISLFSCSEQSNINAKVLQVAEIEQSDSCHLCGMTIMNFEGPKGQLAEKNKQEITKFCSNRDMFSFYLQPENTHRIQEMYVHDMVKTPWESPGDEHFMKASDAWYVYGSNRKAAMGISLASFSDQKIAMTFIKEFGGNMYRFEEITLALLMQDGGMDMSMDMDMSEAVAEVTMEMDN